MRYSIIVPVYNEAENISALLEGLKPFSNNHEILIIDDGSNDGTESVLKICSFINLITFKTNKGKGIAVKKGLDEAQYNKIVLFDGDMELNPKNIKDLMILEDKDNIRAVIGFRDRHLSIYNPIWSLGNFIFTIIFNIRNHSDYKDSLSCAKAFYKEDINVKNLKSVGFEIDVELASMLTYSSYPIKTVSLPYSRRTKAEGKKLKLKDGWCILNCILKESP